jgi:dipeptidase E
MTQETAYGMAQEHAEEGIMRFLLTSAGIKNTSIHNALVDLLGKPIAESSALCIPTAAYGHPHGGSWCGMAVHQRTRTYLPHVRIGLEVLGGAGADRAAQHR